MIPEISIIIPVYNAGKFLDQCLTSILCQTFNDWECIVVDDGSTDNSGLISDSYGKKDGRFKIYHKNNGGVSSARNFGLQYATGKWVIFVDADDALFEYSLETLYSFTRDDIDIIIGGYVITDEKGTITESSNEISKETLDWQKLPLHFYYPYRGKYFGYLWNRLMRLEVIRKNNIKFREDIFIKEDGLFGVQYICNSKKDGLYYTKPVYKYTINSNGAMKSIEKEYNPKYLTDLDACILIYEEIKKSGCKDKKTIFYAKMYVCTMYDLIIKYLHTHGMDDDITVNGLRQKTIESVSYPFFVVMRAKAMIRRFIKR